MSEQRQRREPGVAVVGAGRIGAMRARLAATHPAVNAVIVATSEHEHTEPVLQALAQVVEIRRVHAIAYSLIGSKPRRAGDSKMNRSATGR